MRKRVLCLTDGRDSSSTARPLEVVQGLQDSGIVVDSIIVGAIGSSQLRAVSVATGAQPTRQPSVRVL